MPKERSRRSATIKLDEEKGAKVAGMRVHACFCLVLLVQVLLSLTVSLLLLQAGFGISDALTIFGEILVDKLVLDFAIAANYGILNLAKSSGYFEVP